MMSRQMQSDLLNNALERLNTWEQDTVMRCRAGDLTYGQTIAIITFALMSQFTYLISQTTTMTPEQATKHVAHLMRSIEKEHAKNKGQSDQV